MANNPHFSNTSANAAANAIGPLLNTGYLRIYDSTGTGQPANANTAVSTQVLLAELRFNSTFSPSAVAGVLTANAIADDTAANNTGTATWFRCLESDGSTVIMDGSVGTSGCDLNMNSTAIQANADVSVTAFTLTVTE